MKPPFAVGLTKHSPDIAMETWELESPRDYVDVRRATHQGPLETPGFTTCVDSPFAHVFTRSSLSGSWPNVCGGGPI